MNRLLIIAAVVVSCQASSFVNAPRGKGCSYPDWKCNCRLVYRCDGISRFPSDTADDSVLKDLAPGDYQLRIPGKRWRREIWSQEEFCKRECNDRLNAFLCLKGDGTPSTYSDEALCLKLFGLDPSPIPLNGDDVPCCEIYLQWGLNWCDNKWYKLVRNVRCLSRVIDGSFEKVASKATSSKVFSVEGGCAADEGPSFTWCDSAPTCPDPPS